MTKKTEQYLAFCTLCHSVTVGSFPEAEAQLRRSEHEKVRGHTKAGIIAPESMRRTVIEKYTLEPENERYPFAVLPIDRKM